MIKSEKEENKASTISTNPMKNKIFNDQNMIDNFKRSMDSINFKFNYQINENDADDNDDFLDDLISPENIHEDLSILNENISIDFKELNDSLIISIDIINDVLKLKERVILQNNIIELSKFFVIMDEDLKLIKSQYQQILQLLNQASLTKCSINKPICKDMNLNNLNKNNNNKDTKLILANTIDELCFPLLMICMEFINKRLLNNLLKYMKLLHENIPSPRKYINEIIILSTKLNTVKNYLPITATYNKNDLFALNKEHQAWTSLQDIVNIKSIGNSKKLKKSIEHMIKHIQISYAMIEAANRENNNAFMKKAYITLGGVYFYFFAEEAQKRAELSYSQPKLQNMIEVWNLMDTNVIKSLMKIILPRIAECKKIYIGRQYPGITHELILKEVIDGTINHITPIPNINKRKKDSMGIKKKDKSKIKIRILSDKKIPFINEQESENFDFFNDNYDNQKLDSEIRNSQRSEQSKQGMLGFLKNLSCMTTIGNDQVNPFLDPYFDGLVIHIHGGGFVSMSSGSHQIYTRKWAKMLKKTVFSIDYRLAPEHPFPKALDDCWQAYNWIVDHAQIAFGITPSKVILAGDSAGGNLALCVALRAIKAGYRIPDGLLLAYPALNMSSNHFSPSLLLAMDDQIVPYSYLQFCINAYVPKDFCPDKNPFISPIFASDEILLKLPPVRIVVGQKDPLHDECWRFIYKLKNLQKDAKMIIYEGLPHGFLNYDIPYGGISEAIICIEDSVNFMKEMFKKR